MNKTKIIEDFNSEFGFIKDKFVFMDLLENNPLDSKIIESLKLPSEDDNIVWHAGVYFFIGNNSIYRIGVSMNNSRARVLQHLDACTSKDGHCILDIDKYEDKSILLCNVKEKASRHWLLSIEAYFEEKYKPLIKASRIG